MVEVQNIKKRFESSNGAIHVLDQIDFTVAKGEFVSIVGPSGCGKSTLLKIIGDLIEPTSGQVLVDGMTARQARLKRMFSFVFQNPVLLAWRHVIDNVRLPCEILKIEGRDPYALLRMVGLEGYEHLYPHQLSGGMKQRAALVRALTFDPQILLMDEPFGAVDELTRESLNTYLLHLWREIGVTTFLITHSLSEAVFLSDRVLLLSARPARLKFVLDIPFGRPRTEDMKKTPPFQELVLCLKEKLE